MASLFDPIRIGRITLPNRIIMAPLTRPDRIGWQRVRTHTAALVEIGAAYLVADRPAIALGFGEWPRGR